MKKKILILSIFIISIIVIVRIKDTEANALTIENGKPYHLLFFKYNDKNMMLPIKKTSERFDYTIGIDSNFDGKVDEEYTPTAKTKQTAKAQVLKQTNFNVYINNQKVNNSVKFFENTDIYNDSDDMEVVENGVALEDLNSVLILGIEGEVSSSEIISRGTYGEFGWNLPVTINGYGQLTSSSWLLPEKPTKSQKDFLVSNGYKEMSGEFLLDENVIDKWNNAFDPRRLEIYIPAYFLDSTLYDLPQVEGKIGSTLSTTAFKVEESDTVKDVEYIKLSDLVYINSLCGHLGDVDLDETETECTEGGAHIKDLIQFKWTLNPDIWIEKFSGRLYINGDEQPAVQVIDSSDKEGFELIKKGAHDASDKLTKISDYGINDALPLNTEMLTLILSQPKLPDPIIVIDRNFGNFTDSSYGTGVRINVSTLGDEDSAKGIGRGFNTKSEYIFQRVKLEYSEEANIENGTTAATSCPTGDESDCVFFFEATDENLSYTKNHYGDRFDMYASDLVIEDNETTEVKEIKTCRDLESIGRGENYPGASHYEAWTFDQDYVLANDINCYETTQKNSIYDDNLEDNIADGFEPLGYNFSGVGGVAEYTHTFDGNGHTISNLHMDHDYTNVGLFAKVGTSGKVKDLTFTNSNINISSSTQSQAYAGTVAGENYGTIENVAVEGDNNLIVSNDSSISFTNGDSYSLIGTGGIVGYNFSGKILNSYVIGNVKGTNSSDALIGANVGGIAGFNSGQISNTYAKAEVKGRYNVGGLIGYNYSTVIDSLINGCLENSYSVTKVDGKSNVGGVVGTNIKSGSITNVYATSTLKRSEYSAGYVKGETNVGGVVGYDSGEVKNTYSAIPVEGKENVGGIVGNNTGDIRDSFSVGNIKGEVGKVGAIAGVNENIGTLSNNYGYGTQKISDLAGNSSHVKKSTLVGQEKGVSYELNIASDIDLSDPLWFTNKTAGKGLGWSSNDKQNVSGVDWTAPVVTDDSACLPWVYSDSNLDGTPLGNNGVYVSGQTADCFKVLKVPNNVKVENYKINSATKDIILNYIPVDPDEEILTADGDTEVDLEGFTITKVGASTPLTCSPKVSVAIDSTSVTANDRLITFSGSECGIEAGEKYSIDIEGGTILGQEIMREDFNIVLKTPETLGDGVNSNTFVSSSTGFVDPSSVNPTSQSNKFGIYELESIGYENVFLSEANWGENDLTLSKYDHVIRPIGGTYELTSNVEASVTKSNTNLDKMGGFGTDGFRPIGYKTPTSKIDFTGSLSGTSGNRVISELYINLPTSDYVGLISSSVNSSNNISFDKLEIKGQGYVGALAGKSTANSLQNNNISNSSIVATSSNVGGLIGNAEVTSISNSVIDNLTISGSNSNSDNIGGLIGNNVEELVRIQDIQIQNSLTITGNNCIGGIIGLGSLGDVSDITINTININGKDRVGGIVGENQKNIVSSSKISFSNITITNIIDLTGQDKVGGLVGVSPMDIFIDMDNIKLIKDINIIGQDKVGGLIGEGAINIEDSQFNLIRISAANNVGGMIGLMSSNTSINNVDANIDIIATGNNIGGFLGSFTGESEVKDANIEGNIKGNDYVGGYIGKSTSVDSINLDNISFTGNIEAASQVGGSVGYAEGDIKIKGADFIGDIVATNNYVGGLVGQSAGNIEITSSGANTSLVKTGGITGGGFVGGMVGKSIGETSINNSSNVNGAVTGKMDYVGGLVGQVNNFVIDSESNKNTAQIVTGKNYVGGLAGKINTCSIEPLETNNKVIGTGGSYTGGLIGYANECNIDNVITSGTITGSSYTGGIVGELDKGNISNSKHITGDVKGYGYVGGLVGYQGEGDLDTVEVSSKVVGSADYTGGLVGKSVKSNIINSKTTNIVTGRSRTGGLVGELDEGNISNSRHETEKISGVGYIGGLVGYYKKGNLDTVEVTSEVTGTGDYTGGLIGYGIDNNIVNSNSTNIITGKDYTGGIVGKLESGNISNTKHITGNVIGTTHVGGIVGEYELGEMNTVEVASEVTGSGNYVGGLIGYGMENNIISSISSNKVNGANLIGGLVGELDKGNILNSKHIIGSVTGQGKVGGAVGYHKSGNLDTVEVTSEVIGTGDYVGGLIGYGIENNIISSTSSNKVNGVNLIGGLVGELDKGNISNSKHTVGSVTGRGKVGGAVGYHKSGNLDTVEVTSEVIGTGDYVGGLIGYGIENNIISSTSSNKVNGVNLTGGLVGEFDKGNISNSKHTVGSVTGRGKVGGAVGYHKSGNLDTVEVTSEVIGTGDYVGGLIGKHESGLTKNSFKNEDVTSTENYVGGLIGYDGGSITDSYMVGNTSGNDYVGGLVGKSTIGYIKSSNITTLDDYITVNTGNVKGRKYVGGLIGYKDSGEVSGTYATGISVSGMDYVGGLIGQKNGGELKNSLTRSNTINGSGVNIGGLIGKNVGDVYGDSRYETVSDTSIIGSTNTGGLIGISSGGNITLASVSIDVEVRANINVGGLIGYNSSYVNKSNSQAAVKDFISCAGGLIGYNTASVENSYAKGDVISSETSEVISSIGGLIGNNVGGNLSNVYASGDISALYGSIDDTYSLEIGGLVGKNTGSVTNAYADGDVSGYREIGGLIGRNDNANISDTYAYGLVKGFDAVGGLIGYNKDAKVKNSLSTNEIRLEEGIRAGGLIGFDDGDYTYSVDNVYGYEGQKVYFNYSTEKELKNNLIGNDLEYSSYSSYDNVVTPSWYMDGTNGKLKWSDKNWDTSKVGVSDAISGAEDGYYPQLKDTNGNLLLDQDDNPIVAPDQPRPVPTLVENYKINAKTLDVTIKLTDDAMVGIDEDLISKNSVNTAKALVSIYPGDDTSFSSPIYENIEENIVNLNMLRLEQKDYDFEQDTTYAIKVAIDDGTGVENTTTFRIHTPKQVIMSYDLNGNGKIDIDEENLTFAVIGDGSAGNNRTDVDNKFSSDVIEPISPDLLDTSDVIESNNYGIYEIESICSDELLEAGKVWDSSSDTTITKYDHVIRPCGGLYVLNSDIDASQTSINDENDVLGGFDDDGYKPIGTTAFPFQGAIVGGSESTGKSKTRIVNDLFIDNNLEQNLGQGLVGYAQNAYFSNIDLKNINIKSNADFNGSLLGYGANDIYITNCNAYDGNVIGRKGTGGLVGSLGPESYVYDSVSNIKVESGTVSPSGEVISSSNDEGVGGLIGIFLGRDVEDSEYIGNYVHGGKNVGGLIGRAEPAGVIKNCKVNSALISETLVFGEIDNVGGFIGEFTSGTVRNSTSSATVTEHNPINGNLKGTGTIGGFIGMSQGIVTSVVSYGTVDAENLTNVGGLIGEASGGSVSSSHPEVTFDGTTSAYMGGLIGKSAAQVNDCYSKIPIKTTGSYVGGLIGQATSSVENSYTTKDVHGETNYVGGLIGQSTSYVTDSYAKGNVLSNGGNYIGGLVGSGVTITDSYAEGNVGSSCGTLFSSSSTTCESGTNFTGTYVGGLVGKASGTIIQSHALGSVQSEFAGNYIGGLVGLGTTITDSYAEGDVKSLGSTYISGTESYIGGLAGKTTNEVKGSYAKGNVISIDGIGNYIGGLIGYSTGNVSQTKAFGEVSGNDYIGGLIGKEDSISASYNISNGLAYGEISGKNHVGGIVGSTDIPVINNSSYEGNIVAENYVGGIAGESTSTNSSAFSSVTSKTNIIGTGNYVGGIVGSNAGGISTATSKGDVTSKGDWVGGIAGLNKRSVSTASSEGNVSSTGKYVSGGIGQESATSTSYSLSNVDTKGTVKGGNHIGGVVGSTNVVIKNNSSHQGDITGTGDYIGGIAGESTSTYSTAISNVDSIANINTEGNYVGGIVGSNAGGISTATSKGDVTSKGDWVGGIAGLNKRSVSTASSEGNVSSTGKYVSGGIGQESATSTSYSLSNVDTKGTVKGGNHIGGVVGSTNVVIKNNSSHQGDITGTGDYVGGIVGESTSTYSSAISNVDSIANINTEGSYIGGIVGSNAGGISTATSEGNVTSKGDYVGGVAGYNKSSINSVTSKGAIISGGDYIGGVAGLNKGLVSIASSEGNVNSTGKYVSGGIGQESATSTSYSLSNIDTKGTVKGENYVGGVVGSTNVPIKNDSSHQGDITGTGDYVGGIAGESTSTYSSAISNVNSIANINTEGNYVGGIVGSSAGGISTATSEGNVTSKGDWVGGVAGLNKGSVSTASSEGNVSSTGKYVSGGIGQESTTNTSYSLSNVDTKGTVKGENHIGGVVGSTNVAIKNNSSHQGDITGTGDYIGGIVGESTSTYSSAISNVNSIANINTEGNYVGGIVGSSAGGISTATSEGNVTSKGDYVGGIAGYNKSSINSVTSKGTIISGGDYIGGVAGLNKGSVLTASSEGNVNSTGKYVSGGIGQESATNTSYSLSNIDTKGTVKGENHIGGVVGSTNVVIKNNSSHQGDITGTGDYIGGIAGESTSTYSTAISNVDSIANINTEGNYVGGIVGSSIGGISTATSEGNVTSRGDYVGGIAGESTSTYSSAFSKVETKGNVTGAGNYTGGIVGSGKGGIVNSSYGGTLSGNHYVGGLIGEQLGSIRIINSYSQGELNGATNIGGLIGKIENGSLSINNSYSTSNININKDVSPTIESNLYVGGVVGNGQEVKGFDIYNTYSTGDIIVTIEPSVKDVYIGGIVGNYNQKYSSGASFKIEDNYYDGSIKVSGSTPTNMYIGGIIGNLVQDMNMVNNTSVEDNLNSGNITINTTASNLSQVGRIIGNYSRDTSIMNAYTYLNNYYYNSIYTIGSNTNFSGFLADYPEKTEMEYETNLSDMQNALWWSGTKTETSESGLGLESSSVVGQTNRNFTAPWMQDGKYCMPHVMTDSDLNGISSGNNGSYVGEQKCYEIGRSRSMGSETLANNESKVVQIENYKINAMSLDIYIKVNISQLVNDNLQGQIKIYKGNHEGEYPWFAKYEFAYDMLKGDSIVTIPGEILKPDQTYTIVFYDNENIEQDNMVIHTPKQSKINYDINNDGKISNDEKNLTFALIGDQVNTNTDVNNKFSSDKIIPINSDESEKISKNDNLKITNKYGIYELESIGYDESNTKDTSLYTSDWSNSDLTLTKYNHIIRPLTGCYKVIQSSSGATIEENIAVSKGIVDNNNGWSTDTNNDGISDLDDGFNAIGTERTIDSKNTKVGEFKGVIISSSGEDIITNINM